MPLVIFMQWPTGRSTFIYGEMASAMDLTEADIAAET